MGDFLQIALRRSTVKRAIQYTIVVGTILIAINQGDAILHGRLAEANLLKMALTAAVPYIVSTCSSVGAVRAMRKNKLIT